MDTNEVKLPYDLEVEKSFISSLMYDCESEWHGRKLAARLIQDGVSPEMFYFPAHEIIFRELLFMFKEENISVDMMALHIHLKERELLEKVGGPSSLVDISNNGFVLNYDHYLKTLKTLYSKRLLIISMMKTGRDSSDHSLNTDEIVADLTKCIESVRSILTPAKLVKSAKDAGQDYIRFLERCAEARNKGEVAGISTGIPILDLQTGGMRGGELWVDTAETSGGKTALCVQLASSAMNSGKHVLAFSLEGGAEEIFGRLMSHRFRIPYGQITMTEKPTKEWLRRIQQASGEMTDLPFSVVDEAGITLEMIEAISQRMADECEIGLIVVDYIQLIDGKKMNGESREQQLSRFAKALKQLAKRHDCTVITPSQLNDDGKVRESREIANSANVLLSIEAEGIFLAKNRNGKRDVFLPIQLDGEFQTFKYVERP